jgi:radical SAM superfamily enzyme YgiQ (UPF0313 family)
MRRVYFLNPPAADGVRIVREGRCMQREGAWSAVWAPISLALSAAVVREAGHEAALNDCIVEELDFPDLQRIVADWRPDLVLLNTATPSIESDLSAAAAIKEVCPDCRIAAFGIHPMVYPEACLEQALALDYVIIGEPEQAIRDLADALEQERGVEKVQGIVYREGNGVVRTPERPPLRNLDSLPFPAWDLVDRTRYRMPFTDEPFLLVATGRGCPYYCHICADTTFYGHQLALKSPDRIVDELEWVGREFGIVDFLFWSESFTINRRFAKTVAERIIARGLQVRWVCNSRVDNVDAELLYKIRKAGCWMIGYGIEGGTQSTLDRMNKGATLEQAREAVRLARRAGLEVTGHCIVGYPGETIEDMRQTVRFAMELDLDFAQFYCAVPFPGSELLRQAEEQGWIASRDWTRYEQNYSVLRTPEFTPEDVERLRRQAYRQFYLRPKVILRTLRRLRTPAQWRRFLQMTHAFLTWV